MPSFAIYDTASGVIAQIISTPFPGEAAGLLAPGQGLRQVDPADLPDPASQRYDRAGNLVDYQPPVNVEALRAEFRAARNARLAASDWTQFADTPVDATAWQSYRRALRDLPALIDWAAITSLSDIPWPEKPSDKGAV